MQNYSKKPTSRSILHKNNAPNLGTDALVSHVMRYFTGLMRQLIRQSVLEEDDPEIMAAQFCLPISVWINLCDREPDREPEIMELVDKHIRQFFKVYQTKE